MIYLFKKPLMIVGHIACLMLASNALWAVVPGAPAAAPSQAAPAANPIIAIPAAQTAAENLAPTNEPEQAAQPQANSDPSIETAPQAMEKSSESMAPAQEAMIPAEDSMNSGQDGMMPAKDSMVPAQEAMAPTEDNMMPGKDNMMSDKDVMAPSNDSMMPPKDSMMPKEQAMASDKDSMMDKNMEQDQPEMESKIVPTSKDSDVRVLIDISGSMKQNDPENLRIPGLNLIVGMLPEGARSGVWTFGQWVNMLITPETVDDEWREQAKEKAEKINSHGLRTNIGEAMEKALWKLEKDSPFDQHAILLTDGLVDIAEDNDPKQQDKNDAERQRILTDVLNEYKERGVKIHTIALSDNADKTLLEKLSIDTGGMNEVVNSSEDLVKAFLKAFDKAAPEAAEQVPLSMDNTFPIDNSVEEFTALVFRKAGTPPTQLTSPSGKVYSQIKASEDARWFSESVYDLVTIQKPEAGTWKIDAELDPDNRVTVVSDLKMSVENLPNNLFPGQQVDFQIYFHEEGKVLTNADLLKLMTVEMKMTAESGRSGTKVISDPENIPSDGVYRESIKRLSKEGQYELQISVDGKTFTRMRKEYIQVRQPIGFEIRKRRLNGKQSYAVRVIPQVPDIEVARTRVIAKLKGPDQSSVIQAMPWIEEGVWEAVIEPTKGDGEYQISMNIKGLIGKDQDFRIKPDPITLTFPVPDDFTHEYLVQEEEATEVDPPAEEIPAEEEIAPDLAAKAEEAPAEEMAEEETAEEASEEMMEEDPEEEPIDMLWIYISVPVATMVLGLTGFFIYRSRAKKKQAQNTENAKAATEEEPAPAASLNDGMDDEEFDEDFDLSDDGEDEELGSMDPVDEPFDEPLEGGDIDDLDSLDLSNDDEDDIPSLEEDVPTLEEPVEEAEDDIEIPKGEDEIPDFDEDFDLGADDDDAEPAAPEPEADPQETIDQLDDVLDGLGDDDAEPPVLEGDAGGGDGGVLGVSDEPAPEPEPEPAASAAEEGDGEAAIDEALANLENELDDIDIDGLMDEDDDKKE